MKIQFPRFQSIPPPPAPAQVPVQRPTASDLYQQTQRQPVNLNGGLPPPTAGQVMLANGQMMSREEQQYRALIDADMRSAHGRPANQGDYEYWLPKLMGPNDSCTVTGSPPQMTPTEYWHRRMIGWQDGDNDIVGGPYAGSPDRPNGPIQPANEIVPGIPDGIIAPPNPYGSDSCSFDDLLNMDQIFQAQLRALRNTRESEHREPARLEGFDDVAASLGDGSLKGDLAAVLQSLDPNDPDALSKALAILNGKHPGKYSLEGGALKVEGGGSVSGSNGAWSFSAPAAA